MAYRKISPDVKLEGLLEHELSFCIKGKDPRTAQRFARDLCYEDWYPIDYLTQVTGLQELGMQELIEKLMDIPAKCSWSNN